ncbi:hypothetical protein KC19_6G056600 [Ceratodon purpureus]|uniref:Uncharacterized protein n=1 Tax=Ceratodon purpureus TaxID=3225 RepID=A0A8T0HBZ6_CERPU|nr:hypothetical protein KC19_6G056600 [Ceratodon purpureus]
MIELTFHWLIPLSSNDPILFFVVLIALVSYVLAPSVDTLVPSFLNAQTASFFVVLIVSCVLAPSVEALVPSFFVVLIALVSSVLAPSADALLPSFLNAQIPSFVDIQYPSTFEPSTFETPSSTFEINIKDYISYT